MKLSTKKIGTLLADISEAPSGDQKEAVKFLAKVIVKGGKAGKLESIIRSFNKEYNERNKHIDVKVTATDEKNIPHIKELQGKKVNLTKIIDPKILGGVKIQTEDFLLDNTILKKIKELRRV